MNIRATEYLINNKGKQGIYFYGSKIYSFDVPDQLASYEFVLFLKDNEGNVEPITFIDTLNLRNLPTKQIKLRKFLDTDNPIKTIVDWDTFVQQTQPELYKYHKKRLLRKAAKVIPSKKEIVVPWLSEEDKLDFLEFTNNHAFSFELESKYGAAACISSSQIFGYSNYPFDLAPLEEVWRDVDLPYGFTYKSTRDKVIDFNNFPLNIQLELAKRYINSIKHSEKYLPYQVYLAGTDDFSYSKYFCTLEEAEQELDYLRMMQPLDVKLDILDRGYLFTN